MAENELSFEEELAAIQAEFEAQAKAEAEANNPSSPAEPEAVAPVAEPQYVRPGDDLELTDAALSVISRLPRETQIEHLKKLGYDLTPKEELAKHGEQAVETVRQQMTFQQELENKYNTLEDKQVLPTDFHDLDAATQHSILTAAHSAQDAAKKAQEIVSPLMQEYQQRQFNQMLDQAAQGLAANLGNPEAAAPVREYLGKFGPQHVQMFEAEIQQGGGPFVEMVNNNIRSIVNDFTQRQQAVAEIPIPKSEEVVRVGDANPSGELQGKAKEMYDKMAKSGIYKEDELQKIAKELVS